MERNLNILVCYNLTSDPKRLGATIERCHCRHNVAFVIFDSSLSNIGAFEKVPTNVIINHVKINGEQRANILGECLQICNGNNLDGFLLLEEQVEYVDGFIDELLGNSIDDEYIGAIYSDFSCLEDGYLKEFIHRSHPSPVNNYPLIYIKKDALNNSLGENPIKTLFSKFITYHNPKTLCTIYGN